MCLSAPAITDGLPSRLRRSLCGGRTQPLDSVRIDSLARKDVGAEADEDDRNPDEQGDEPRIAPMSLKQGGYAFARGIDDQPDKIGDQTQNPNAKQTKPAEIPSFRLANRDNEDDRVRRQQCKDQELHEAGGPCSPEHQDGLCQSKDGKDQQRAKQEARPLRSIIQNRGLFCS